MRTTNTIGKKRKLDQNHTTVKLYRQLNDRSQLLCLKPGYMMSPSPAEIFNRNFVVTDLIIKYQNTEIFWKGLVNLKSLKTPLAMLVDIGPTHIEVYPNEYDKPVAGKELNRTCLATFSQLKKINRNKLNSICKENDCEVLAVNLESNSFTVEIPHFTKYKFDDVMKDQQGSDKNWEEISELEKGRDREAFGLALDLKQIHSRHLSEEAEMRRKEINEAMPSVLHGQNSLPSAELEQQVRHHNISVGHQIGDERIKGQSATVGINAVVSSYGNSSNIHFILFNLRKQKNRDILNIVMKYIKNESEINEIILSSETSFEVKRVLTLFVICFKFESCLFGFQRRQGNLHYTKIQQTPAEHLKPQYLKNWFEWAINTDKTFKFPENDVLKGLCLRKSFDLVQKSIKFKRYEDAQFLSKIEDQSYRISQSSRNLSIELRAIQLGDLSYFNSLHWIIRFGVFIWYFLFKNQNDDAIKEIIQSNSQGASNYNLERHLLMSFFELPYQPNLLTSGQDNTLPLWWLISNKNNEREKVINHNSRIYKNYRYNLLLELVRSFADGYVALELVSHQKYLTKQEKMRILSLFIKTYPKQAEKVPISDWAQYSDLVNENKAIQSYSNHKYLQSLSYFGKCTNLSQNALNIIQQIALKEEILCGIHQKTIQKSKSLLRNIKSDLLKDHITYLNVALGNQQLTKPKLLSMFQLCKRIPLTGMHKRMLDIIFRSFIKNPHITLLLKKDESFYNQVSSIYTEPSYKLQLKIAKLQI